MNKTMPPVPYIWKIREGIALAQFPLTLGAVVVFYGGIERGLWRKQQQDAES